MKILFFNPSGSIGGGELSLLDLIASFVENSGRTEVKPEMVLLLTESGPLVDAATALGASVGILPLPKSLAQLGDSYGNRMQTLGRLMAAAPQFASYLISLRKFVRVCNPTVIHTNGIKAHVMGSLAVGKTYPIVWHVRDFLGDRVLSSRAIPHFRRRVRGAIAISNAVQFDFHKLMPDTPSERIYDGIDTKKFQPTRESSPLSTTPLKVGLIATYARWKGHQVFIEAAAEVLKKTRAEFWIVGGPIYKTDRSQWSRSNLEAAVEKHQLKPHFKFVDFEPKIEKIFHQLDIVVHASTHPEPFGRTIAEGMASRKAVIASNGGGAAELIEDGVTGLLFPMKSSSKLAEAILRLLQDNALREKLALAAEQSAQEKFARNRLAAQCLEAYQKFGISID